MNKFEFAFIKKHIKKAIYELECANKIKPDCEPIDKKYIEELKLLLTEFLTENQE